MNNHHSRTYWPLSQIFRVFLEYHPLSLQWERELFLSVLIGPKMVIGNFWSPSVKVPLDIILGHWHIKKEMFYFIFLAILSLYHIPNFCFVLSKTASVMILDKKLKMTISQTPIGHSQRFSCHLKIISKCTYSRKESHFQVSSVGQIWLLVVSVG